MNIALIISLMIIRFFCNTYTNKVIGLNASIETKMDKFLKISRIVVTFCYTLVILKMTPQIFIAVDILIKSGQITDQIDIFSKILFWLHISIDTIVLLYVLWIIIITQIIGLWQQGLQALIKTNCTKIRHYILRFNAFVEGYDIDVY